MGCTYLFKDRVFNSEVELDDFLLEHGQFKSELGDIVFSQSQGKNLTQSTLYKIIPESREKRKQYKEWKEQATQFTEDGEPAISNPPFIGVNLYLNGLTIDDKLLFPEFREDSYWEGRFDHWKEGDFTNPDGTLNEFEIEEFNIDPNNPPKILDRGRAEKMRDQMKQRWKMQAKAGDGIHNALQLFFSKVKGEYLFTKSDDEIETHIWRYLENKNRPYIDRAMIPTIIKYARELHKGLIANYGEDLEFYPEFTVTAETNDSNKNTLLGMIDLLILDKDGNVHILDYKTSLHPYHKFNSAKRLSYNYQLNTYKRMLETKGINCTETQLLIAPIQLNDFKRKGDTDQYEYGSISWDEPIRQIATEFDTLNIWSNIDTFLPRPFHVEMTTEDARSTVEQIMADHFPGYVTNKQYTTESVAALLKKKELLKPNNNGVFSFRKYGIKTEYITADNETDFVKKVTTYLQSLSPTRVSLTGQIKSKLKQALKNGINSVDFPSPILHNKDSQVDWLQKTLEPYCNGNWEIQSNPILESYGLIMLKTVKGFEPEQVDIIRITSSKLDQHYKFYEKESVLKNRRGLTGNHETDLQANSKPNSLMLEAVNGNVELIETLAVLTCVKGLETATIGNIQVINPYEGRGMSASNEELIYCYNELDRLKAIPNNRIKTGQVKLARQYERVAQKFEHIMTSGENIEWNDEYKFFKQFKSAKPIVDQIISGNKDEKIKALQELLSILEGRRQGQGRTALQKELDSVYGRQSDLKKKHIDLYNTILAAIADLKGINFRQQLKDHKQWFETILIHKHGLTGSYIDNPGNLNSETLNLVTKLVTEAYQNTRAEIQNKANTIRHYVEAIKKNQGFSKFKENTYGNQVNLYKDLFKEVDGDLLFVRPEEVYDPQKKAFLEYVLNEINKDRFPGLLPSELEDKKNSGDLEYYRVPLCVGGSDSTMSQTGLMATLRARLSSWLPKNMWDRAKQKLEGVFSDDESDTQDQHKTELMYQMANMFDVGNDVTKRLEKIKEFKEKNIPFEMNLETLLLKHMFAYSTQRNMDAVFPLIKASMVHIQAQGAQLNTFFRDDVKYLDEYIRNKIFNKTIVEPVNQGWVKVANVIKQAASMFTLAIAPVQMFYQPLQGLWQDISLMIRKPDGKESFTFRHFTRATKLVFGDLFHYSNTPTLCQALNELYGINDMDMNTYVDRISHAKSGIWNFNNFLFKFASRPDFYNRMTIFTSQMMADGCLEAHSINDKGELVYDWTKDARFSEFAKNPTGNSEIINKQRSLYYAVAQQFVNEHATDKNGDPFEINMKNPKPLPRAYTNKQAESMKSLGDDIYGYYSHEKKSLIMSTAIGSLWLQFRTYWSGKKNQYLGGSGIKLKGSWEHFQENGKKYYYQIGNDGEVLYNEPFITEEEAVEKKIPLIAPVMQWKGQWQEGIMLTLADMAKTMWRQHSIRAGWEDKWNNSNKDLQLAYRSNLKQIAYDTTMFLIVGSIIGAALGDWLDELMDSNRKNRDLTKGLALAAANVAVLSVKNSFLDLNFIESIGSPFGQWTPFAFEWTARQGKLWWNVAMGDEDFWDGVVKTSGGLKQVKPALDSIKPDMFRTEREGGTFGVED